MARFLYPYIDRSVAPQAVTSHRAPKREYLGLSGGVDPAIVSGHCPRQNEGLVEVSIEVAARPRVGIAVLVIRDGQLLLGERTNSHGSGTWQLPGGHLEYGETPARCAARELFEETGLSSVDAIPGPWADAHFEAEGKHYVSLFMVVRRFEGVPVVKEPGKCLRWEWFDIDNLPEPLFLPIQNLLRSDSLQNVLARYPAK